MLAATGGDGLSVAVVDKALNPKQALNPRARARVCVCVCV